MLYVTVMQGYRAIFRTKKDAVEAGLVADVIEDCREKGLVVLCDMDSKMRYHYFVGLPITEDACLCDGKMVSAKAPKKNKREIKAAWDKLQRALNAPIKKKYGYGVHALARA